MAKDPEERKAKADDEKVIKVIQHPGKLGPTEHGKPYLYGKARGDQHEQDLQRYPKIWS
jgi:hypothetical protein